VRIIQHPQIEIVELDGDPSRRRIQVSYDLVTAGPDEPGSSTEVTERVVVHAVDRPGGVLPPASEPLLEEEITFAAVAGTVHREIEATVTRDQLDVEPDWWRTDLDGAVQGIAEWADHIVGEIRISINGHVIDEAKTSEISGSWGILGAD